jgi:hypothetical protein
MKAVRNGKNRSKTGSGHYDADRDGAVVGGRCLLRFVEVVIPLPEVNLITDDFSEMRRGWVPAMESLAEALLEFATHTRKQYPSDFE